MAREGGCGVVRPCARGGLSVLCRGRIRGVGTGPPGSDAWSGRVETVLHIRPGPAGDGSAESCGNAPAFNTVETLPCAEQVLLHMGARLLGTDVPGRTAESRGKPGIGPRGCACPMCNTPATRATGRLDVALLLSGERLDQSRAEPVQDPGVNTPGEGDGGNSLNRVVVVPSFVVALTEGVGHPLGVVLGVDGRDRSCVSSLR